MSFSLEEYAKKRRGTETPSASPRSGTDDGIKQAGGFSLAEYHRQKTGGAESQTFGILGSGNKKISPSGAGAKQTAQPKQKPPVATAAPMGLADLQAEKRWIAGELEKGRKRREAVKTQPAAAKKAPTGLGAIKELDRSLQAQRDYEVYKATGELPAEPGQIRGMQPLADKDLKRAREAERQARAAYQAVTGPTTTYPTGEQPQPSVPYAAGLQSREQQRRAEDRPVVEALLPTGPARAEAKGRVYDLDGAYGAAVERKKWDAMPTDLEELKARKETVTAERDEAEREMKRLWAERYALGDDPAKEAERAELTAKYDAAAAAYKEKDRELTQLGQRQYEQRNTQAFGRMSGDEDVGEVFQSALEIQDDMDRILAYMANSRRGGVDTPTARQFVDQVKEKYGITASGQGELQQICGQLRQRLEAARGQVSEAGYDFRDMAIYTRREEKAREQAKRNEQTAQFAEKHPVIASAASGVASLAQWADLGNMDWGHGKPGDEDYVPPDTSAMGIVSYVNTVRGTVGRKIETNTDAELFGRNVGSFLYQTGMSMVDSGLSIATLGPGSIYLMGANAAVNTSKEIVDRGGTADQAFWGGLAAGAAEMLFEKVSVDRLLTPKSVDGWKDVVRELLTQGGVEASEEVCTEIANILSDTAIMGANSNYANAVRDYRAQGMSEEEAKRQAYLDQLGQVAEAGLGGFVSGVGMAGGKVAVDYAGQGERRVWEAAPYEGQGTRTGLEPAPAQAQKSTSVGEVENRLLTERDLGEYLSAGERQHVRNLKDAQVKAGDSPILTSLGQIRSFIRSALTGETRDTIKGYGKVGTRMAGDLRAEGVDVSGYYLELDSNRLGHMSDHIGDDGDPRNIPLTQEQVENLISYIDDYDDVLDVVRHKDGGVRITLGKRINGHAVVVELVSKGRRSIQPVTAWQNDTEHYLKKYGKQRTQAINTSHFPQGEARGYKQSTSKDSIPKSAQGVKAEARRAHEAEVLEGLPLVKRMGASGRTGLTNILDTRQARGGLSDELERLKLAEGYQELYIAGLSGVELEPGDIPLTAGPNAELLDPVERLQAYHNGVNDAKAQAELNRRKAKYATVAGTEKGLVWDEEGWVAEHLSEEEADRIHEVARRLGVRVRFADQVAGGLANGEIVGADIQIAKDAEQPIMVVFGHEVGHWLERTAPEAYQAVRAFASQHRMAEVEGLMELYDRAGQERSFDEALKELANDDIGRMIADPQMLQSFIEANKTNRTLLQRLADAFRALWQKLTGKDRQQVKTAEEALLAALKASEAQAAKLERAGQVMDFAQEQGEGGEYSIKRTRTMDWTTQVNGWFDHDGTIKSSDSLYLGESETWLENVTSAPLYIPGSVMTKATRVPKGSKSGHAMTQAELLQLSERIKSAPAVIVNPSRNALIYVTDMEDSHGWPVIAAFDMNNDLHGEVAHKATSIYGRESGLGGLFGNLGEDATIFVQSKSKFDALLSGTGKLYPQLLAKIKLADGSVAQAEGGVKHEFSLKAQSQSKMKELERENQELRERYEYWKGQTKRSQAGKVSEEATGRYISSIMQDFGIKGDAKALTMKLLALYDGMASGTDADGDPVEYQDFSKMAKQIAGELVRNAVTVDSSFYDDYAELRAYIRRTPIVVDAETRASMADYEDFRKGSMGRLRLQHGETGNIDQVYTDLARMWPELFSEEVTAEQDQLERIAQVMGQIYAREEINPFGGDLAGATEAMAHEIMEQFWEIPGEKATYADRQWRIRQEMKRQHMAEIRTAIRAEREKGKVNERNLKEWYRDRDARNRAYKAESEARNRLLKLAARMKRMPTDGVTKALIRELVGELDTEARHLTGKKLAELTELRRFCEAKADPDSESYDPDFILDAGAASALKRLEMKHIDDLTIQEVQELTKVLLNLEHEIRTSKRLVGEQEDRDIYQLGERVIKDVRAVKGGDKAGISTALDKYIVTETLSPLRQVRRMVGYREDSPLVKLTESLADGQRKMLDYQMRAEKPFERFANDKAFSKGFSGKDAKTVKILGMVQGRNAEVEVTRAMMVSLWLHSQNDQNALHMRDGGVRVPDMGLYRKGKFQKAYAEGTLVKVSPALAKGLWGQMTKTEREFARAAQDYFGKVSKPAINEVSNILKGYDLAEVENYFPIQTDKTFVKTDLETLKFDGTIEGMGFLKSRASHAHSPMVLEDVNSVVERAIRMHGKYVGLAVPVRNFGKVWNVRTAARVEETQKTVSTGETVKVQSSSEGNYIRIEDNSPDDTKSGVTAQGGVTATPDEVAIDQSIPQPTQGVKWSSNGDNVQNAILAVWGPAGYNYLVKLMTDLQGGGKDAAAWAKALRKVRSNYAGAVLTLNASVAMKQAASYPTAAAVLGWKPLAQAMKDFGKVDLDLIAKYTPLQAYRSKGFSSRELGDIQTQGGLMKEVLSHKALNWIQGVDLATTRKLWKASEYYIRENSPKLAVGTDDYYKAVAEIYNRVIEETQPNYTTMQRPQMLRSDSSIIGELMMFKTQPFQNFNILYDAAGEYRAVMARLKAGEATKAQAQTARQNLNRAVTSQVAQLGVFAAMTMLWGMFRGRKDKYDKDGDGEIDLFGALSGMGKDMVGGAATMVPWGSEVWEFASSKIFGDRYYGIEPVGIGAITDTASALSKMGSTIWDTAQSAIKGEKVDWKSLMYQMDDCWDDVSKVAGIPYENVTNLFNAFARWACIAAKGEYLGEYAAMHMTTDSGKSQSAYMDLLFRAMEKDSVEFSKLYVQMMEDGFDADKVKSAMEERMKKAEGVKKVSDLEQRFLAPEDQREYDAAMKVVRKTDLWDDASQEQRKALSDDVYDFLTRAGGATREETWEAWETAGFDETTYALYQLAREMTDQPNKNGKLGGSPTNEEREDAIALIPGLTVAEKAALWELAGGKEKSNPWG